MRVLSIPNWGAELDEKYFFEQAKEIFNKKINR